MLMRKHIFTKDHIAVADEI